MRLSTFKVRLLHGAVAFLASGLATAGISGAATYYVATDGSDLNPGTITQPFRTIAKGTSALLSGDTLYIRGGVYDEIIRGFAIPSGSSTQHTVVAGYPGENPIIRPTLSTYLSAGNGLIITLFGRYITLRDFTIDGINTDEGGTALYITSDTLVEGLTVINLGRDGIRPVGPNITIRRNNIKDCGRRNISTVDNKGLGIHANSDGGGSQTHNLLIEYNTIEGCRAGGIAVHQFPDPGPTGVIVRYNIVRNLGALGAWPPENLGRDASGILMAHGINQRQIYGNLIYNVRSDPDRGPSECLFVWAGGAADRGDSANYLWYNNTCYNADAGVLMWDDVRIRDQTFRNNIYSSVSQVQVGPFGIRNNVNTNYVTNPTFANISAGDFSLVEGSAGIDAGVTPPFPIPVDLNGTPRPQGCCYDVGAYEYTVSGTVAPPSSPANLQVAR